MAGTMPHDDPFDHGTPSEGFADHTHEEHAGASPTEGLSAFPTVGGAGPGGLGMLAAAPGIERDSRRGHG